MSSVAQKDGTFGVDAKTRVRIGELLAHGVDLQTIADCQVLTLEQVEAARTTEECRMAHARVVGERMQRAADMANGWDMIEAKAISRVFDTLEMSSNPDYALRAAAVANRAVRKDGSQAKVVDASRVAKVVVLHLSRGYVEKAEESGAMIDVTPRSTVIPQQRTNDMPTPKRVSEILGRADEVKAAMEADVLEFQLSQAGVFDGLEE